jgi:thioredoxin-dependent peroxiredoxin
MRQQIIKALGLLSILSIALLTLGTTARAELKVGDPAPDFRLPGSDGVEYSLSQFKGEKPVVIAFFPKAFTGG